jgi:hypothetical protein
MTFDGLAPIVLADMLCAAADDLGIALTRRDADRLADHVLGLLEVAGYELRCIDDWITE